MANITSGMIMKVLPQNPLDEGQSAILSPGWQLEYPDAHIFIINNSDFMLFANMLSYHGMKLSRIGSDDNGNILYAIEAGPVELSSEH